MAQASTKSHRLSFSFSPGLPLLATCSSVLLIAAAGLPGNCFFKTSINPTLLRSLPTIACLKAGRSSALSSFLGFESLDVCPLADDFGESILKKELTGLVDVGRILLTFTEVFFITFKGSRGGSIDVVIGAGCQ